MQRVLSKKRTDNCLASSRLTNSQFSDNDYDYVMKKIKAFVKRDNKITKFNQGVDEFIMEHQSFDITSFVNKHEKIISLMEDCVITLYQLYRSRNATDVTVAFTNFLKLRTDKSICNQLVTQFVSSSALLSEVIDAFVINQHQVSALDVECGLDNFLDKIKDYDSFKKSSFFKNGRKILMSVLCFTILGETDLVRDMGITPLYIEMYKSKHFTGKFFFIDLLTALAFVCKKGLQIIRTGDSSCVFISSESIVDWLEEANFLTVKIKNLTNISQLGMSEFELTTRVNQAIIDGENFMKFVATSSYEKTHMQRLINELRLAQDEILCKDFALSSRDAPFALIIYGETKVGKSSFSDVLYAHFGKKMKLPTDEGHKYVLPSVAKFWDNFRSHMWCLLIDDAAAKHPNKTPNGDESVTNMLQIINNVPFCPNQASLEDKGRTPFRGKLVLVTTNIKDLHADREFDNPDAVLRRFQYVITIYPSTKYDDGHGHFDLNKLPKEPEDGYPNYWRIKVEKNVPRNDNGRKYCDKEIVDIFSDIWDETGELVSPAIVQFLAWYNKAVDSHFMYQGQANLVRDHIANIKLCEKCCLYPCWCHRVHQSGNVCGICHQNPCVCICSECNQVIRLCMCYIPEQQDIIPTSIIESDYEPGPGLSFAELLHERHRQHALEYYERLQLIFATIIGKCLGFGVGLCAAMLDYAIYVSIWLFAYNKLCPLMQARLYLPISITGKIVSLIVIYFYCWSPYTLRKWVMTKIDRFIPPVVSLAVRAADFAERHCTPKTTVLLMMLIPVVTGVSCLVFVKGLSHLFMYIFGEKKQSLQKHEGEVDNGTFNKVSIVNADLPRPVLSSKGLLRHQFIDIIKNNLIHVTIEFQYNGKMHSRVTKAFAVNSQSYMINTHVFKLYPDDPESIMVDNCVITTSVHPSSSINGNKKFCLLNMDRKDLGNDVSVLTLRGNPPVTDLRKYIVDEDLDFASNGFLVQRTNSGDIKIMECSRVAPVVAKHGIYYAYTSDPVTSYGDCGSLLVLESPSGYVIVGIHSSLTTHVFGSIGLSGRIPSEIHSACDGVSRYESLNLGDYPLDPIVHRKSFLHELQGSALVYGSLRKYSAKTKSNVQPTPILETLKEVGFEETHGAPIMDDNRPYLIAGEPLLNTQSKVDEQVLKIVSDQYFDECVALLPNNFLDDVDILEKDENINGIDGIQFIDAIPRKTSAGWPRNKSKQYYMLKQPDNPDKVDFTQDVWDDIAKVEEAYDNNRRYGPIFRTCLKDEALPYSKIERGKTRIFSSCPVELTYVMRKNLLPIVRVIQRHRSVFECQVGITAQSLDWHEFMEYITKNGKFEHFIDGDYADYDKRMFAIFILEAMNILARFMDLKYRSTKDLKYERAARHIRCFSYDCAFPVTVLKEELIELFGGLPSGIPITAIVNSIVGSLYIRYVYAILNFNKNGNCECKSFRRYVRLGTYGDDNIMGVDKQIVDWFNHTTIRDTLFDELGITYTMGTKDAEEAPFTKYEDLSFLKRSFIFSEELGCIVGPLNKKSISKMLTIFIPSKAGINLQIESIMMSAMRESFFWGREYYEEMKQKLLYVCGKHPEFIVRYDIVFPTFDYLVGCFWRSSLQDRKYPRIGRRSEDRVRVDFPGSSLAGPDLLVKPKADTFVLDLDEYVNCFAVASKCFNPPECSSKSVFTEELVDSPVQIPAEISGATISVG